jgi:phosphonate dehydrogenase
MAPKLTVVVSNRVHPEVVAWLSGGFEVIANQTPNPWSPATLVRHCADAAGLLAFMTDRIDAEFLRACPRLTVIACALKGFDNIDVAACTARNVLVTIAPDLLTAPTAELAVALTLALCRNVLRGDAYIRSGAFRGWRPHLYGLGLQGSTVGLVGMGAVGRAIAQRLTGFGPRLIYTDPLVPAADHAVPVPWEQLLGESDVLIAAVPLTPATTHLIDTRALARMKPASYLVNVGRGSVVDEDAVADALAGGRLAGYAADVFAMEDQGRTDPPRRIPQTLLDHRDRTVFTPHLGSAVAAVRREIEMSAVRDIVEALAGRIPASAINKPDHTRGDDATPGALQRLNESGGGTPRPGGRPASRLRE